MEQATREREREKEKEELLKTRQIKMLLFRFSSESGPRVGESWPWLT